jgi:hypothetical protein
MGASLKALGRVLAEGRAAVLLLADSVVAGKPVFAVDLVRNVAGRAGFAVRAVASQARPHFHAGTARAFTGRPRGEHAILLTRLTQLSSGASQTHPPAPRHGR